MVVFVGRTSSNQVVMSFSRSELFLGPFVVLLNLFPDILRIGKVDGGIAPNVIAQECTFFWDVRTIPGDTPEGIYEEFKAYCDEREAELRKVFPGFSIQTETDHPAVPGLDTSEEQEVVGLIKELSGREDLGTVAYAAEAGQFANEGFQSVICGPGDIAQAHRADEFIHKAQLDEGVAFMHRLIEKLS